MVQPQKQANKVASEIPSHYSSEKLVIRGNIKQKLTLETLSYGDAFEQRGVLRQMH